MDSLDTWPTQRSTHIDIMASGGDSTDADAAAGGCRPPLVSRPSPRKTKPGAAASKSSSTGGTSSSVVLPVTASCGGTIASAGAVMLQKEIGDAVALHRSAMAAVDRISKQQAALRRFPVVCPSCSTLNAPDGDAWGAGDICACKSCNRSFVPLGQGCLQDSDLSVLRLALQQLLVYTDRVQTLEQQLMVKRPLGPRPASKPSAAAHAEPRPSSKCRVPPLSVLQATALQADKLSPCREHLLSPRARHVVGSEEELVEAVAQQPARLPILSPAPAAGDAAGAPWSRPAAGAALGGVERRAVPPNGDAAPKLIAFMDTQDLMSSRGSVGSLTTMDFICPRKGDPGAEDSARNALEQAKQSLASSRPQPPPANALGFAAPTSARQRWPLEREDGEVTSSCESEGRDSQCFKRYGGLPRKGQHLKLAAAAEAASRRLDAHKRRKSKAVDLATEGSPQKPAAVQQLAWNDPTSQPKATGKTDCGTWTTACLHLAALFAICQVVRCFVRSLLASLLPGQNLAPSLLAAMAAASAAGLFRAAQRTLEVGQMFETAQLNWSCHRVELRAGGPTWTLASYEISLEEAFGLSIVLVQVAAQFFFESWGLHGPPSLQRASVGLHACFAAALTAVAHTKLTQGLGLPDCGGPSRVDGADGPPPASAVAWLDLAVGNAATASWAAATWWQPATLAGGAGPADTLVAAVAIRLPVMATAAMHVANFWLAQRVRQPELLAGCVAFGGVSMAIGCWGVGEAHGTGGDPDVVLGHLPCVYAAFCALGAYCLLQEFLRDL